MAVEAGNGSDGDSGCWSCVSTILAFIVLWALLFGVTVGGKHYGLSCGNNGVEIEEEKK